MSSSLILSLSNHDRLLADSLAECYRDRPERPCGADLKLVLRDGHVYVHAAVVAAVSPFMRRILQPILADERDVAVTVVVPNCGVVEARFLARLLYTGSTSAMEDEEQLVGLQDLSSALKLRALSVTKEYDGDESHFDDDDDEEDDVVLNVEELKPPPRKRAKKVGPMPPTAPSRDDSPVSVGTRRKSCRSKTKSKKLDDYVMGKKDVETMTVDPLEELPSDQSEDERTTSKARRLLPIAQSSSAPKPIVERQLIIADVAVRVRQPDNSAFEVQSDDVESLFSSDVAEKIVKKCIVCTKSFLGKFAFSQHLREGHDASEGPFSCPSCAVNCADGTMLLEHLSAVHRDEEFMAAVPKSKRSKETFQCDTVPCSIADHVFTSFTAFKMHTISVHGIFPLRCDVCGNRYKERQTLRNHLETHGGEMRYPCDVCASSGISKKFVTRERLFAHRRLHLGRRFVCEICDFRGRSGTALRTHIVMRHKERRFSCEVCRKRFGSKQNLEAHLRVHTGETPWDCPICRIAFRRLHHFRQHLRTAGHEDRMREARAAGQKLPDGLDATKMPFPTKSAIQDSPALGNENNEPDDVNSCTICSGNLSYKRAYHFQMHLKSKQHSSTLAGMRAKGLSIPNHLLPPKDPDESSETELTYDSRGQATVKMRAPPDCNFIGNEKITVFSLDDNDGAVLDEELVNFADIKPSDNSGLFLQFPSMPPLDADNVQFIVVKQEDAAAATGGGSRVPAAESTSTDQITSVVTDLPPSLILTTDSMTSFDGSHKF